MVTEPLSQRRRQGSGAGCLAAFFGLFALVGGVATWFVTIRPLVGLVAARSWVETPCTILASQVAESSDSDGTTYKVDVRYSYVFAGGEHRSERYDFFDAYSSGYQGKADVVARYPPGARTVCYVNPADPSEAVIDRSPAPRYLVGLVPLVFLFIGVGGIVFALRQTGRVTAVTVTTPSSGAWSSTPTRSALARDSFPAVETGPLDLRPNVSPLGKFVGLTFAALFWNGIVSVFVWQAVQGWRAGQPDGCLTLFLVPFVLVGLALVAGAFQNLLALANPRPRLTLSPGVLTPGGAAYLQWKMVGRASRIRRLRIVLEGREEARYRRGTDTYTDRETFATIHAVETDQPFEIPAGSAHLSIPEGTMHSFAADNNKIVWMLKAECEIPGWPDSVDEYEIQVKPLGESA
jgi:Protein of unknown function (DUF3592)